MNPRQRKFALAYTSSGNATRAAIDAGYSARTAYSIGQRLLKNVEIANHIQEIKEREEQEMLATTFDIQRFWTEVMLSEDGAMKDRLKASELLARSRGAFLAERIEVAGAEEDQIIFYLPENGRDKLL